MFKQSLLLSLAALGLADFQDPLQEQPSLPTVVPHRSQPSVCPHPPQLSCQRGGDTSNTCCLNHPGGQFALTQFWNSDASKGPAGYLGPSNSWTLHGLWPDHCDGTYDSSCDPSRSGDCSRHHRCNAKYHSIHGVLQHFGRSDLVEYMGKFWKGIRSDENIWQHEWTKHGTCISTLHPRCYADYQDAEEVVNYFAKAVELFQDLPTYVWLEEAGIAPDTNRTYDLDAIVEALTKVRGVSPIVACQGHELREVWYHFNVRGSLQLGHFEPSEPELPEHGRKGCPSTGIRYLPKDE